MKFAVLSDDTQWEILTAHKENMEWKRVSDFENLLSINDVDAYFNFMENAAEENYSSFTKPTFINSAVKTLAQINKNENTIRVNVWPGFIEKPLWELVGNVNADIAFILKALGKKYIAVADEPGFVSARVIAMIISEAYFAKEDNVSSETEIDIAMKLGTNYPYGPFEWASKIGLKNVYDLLNAMALEDEKYSPSNALKTAFNY